VFFLSIFSITTRGGDFLSSTNYEKIQNYLDLCDQKVISPALREGLDVDCYHRYLQEMYFAIPKDSSYRTVYECSIYGICDAATEQVDLKKPTAWAFSYAAVFRKQIDMLMGLMAMMKQNCDEADLRDVLRAQLRFIKMVLYRQRLILDTILVHMPSKILLECKTNGSQEYADALDYYQKAVRKMDNLIEKLPK